MLVSGGVTFSLLLPALFNKTRSLFKNKLYLGGLVSSGLLTGYFGIQYYLLKKSLNDIKRQIKARKLKMEEERNEEFNKEFIAIKTKLENINLKFKTESFAQIKQVATAEGIVKEKRDELRSEEGQKRLVKKVKREKLLLFIKNETSRDSVLRDSIDTMNLNLSKKRGIVINKGYGQNSLNLYPITAELLISVLERPRDALPLLIRLLDLFDTIDEKQKKEENSKIIDDLKIALLQTKSDLRDKSAKFRYEYDKLKENHRNDSPQDFDNRYLDFLLTKAALCIETIYDFSRLSLEEKIFMAINSIFFSVTTSYCNLSNIASLKKELDADDDTKTQITDFLLDSIAIIEEGSEISIQFLNEKKWSVEYLFQLYSILNDLLAKTQDQDIILILQKKLKKLVVFYFTCVAEDKDLSPEIKASALNQIKDIEEKNNQIIDMTLIEKFESTVLLDVVRNSMATEDNTLSDIINNRDDTGIWC